MISYPSQQRGAALLTAMVLVVMVVVMLSELSFSQWKAGRRYAASIQDEQALSYGLGAEGWVKHILANDQNDSNVDHLNETWHDTLQLPIEGGAISGSLEDLNGRFNLNNLLDANGEPVPSQVDVFERLLTDLDIELSLVPRLLDWMDSDGDERFPDGAEDNAYTNLVPPYRPLNARLTDASEIAALLGVRSRDWRVLQPHITALPSPTPMNINTLTEKVYLALSPAHTPSTYEAYAERRLDAAFLSIADWDSNSLDTVTDIVDVESNFFALKLDVWLGERQLRLYSVFERTPNGAIFVRLRYFNPTFI